LKLKTIDSQAVVSYLEANSPLKKMDFKNNYLNMYEVKKDSVVLSEMQMFDQHSCPSSKSRRSKKSPEKENALL
jgi:hypothetical protein